MASISPACDHIDRGLFSSLSAGASFIRVVSSPVSSTLENGNLPSARDLSGKVPINETKELNTSVPSAGTDFADEQSDPPSLARLPERFFEKKDPDGSE